MRQQWISDRPGLAEVLAKRDRLVDFVRAASILVVVVGHWLMAVVAWDGEALAFGNVLADVDGVWLATWLFQVMPLFFFVGGFANLRSLESASRRRESYQVWLARRVRRILRPTLFFLAVALPSVALLELSGERSLGEAAILLTQLFWFFGVYLGVIALAPAMLRWHRRSGLWVLVVLATAALIGDVARFGTGDSLAGTVNFPAVWLFAHQLGFFYSDGRISRRSAAAMAAGGLAVLAALVLVGPHPASMVGMPGQESNMNPPTLAILFLGVWQAGLILLVRSPLDRWLERPLPWAAVVVVNQSIMTILLWHLPVLLIVSRILYPLGAPQPEVGTAVWWLLRPTGVAILGLALTVFVASFRRLEELPPDPQSAPTPGGAAAAALGIVLLIFGMLGFALAGPTGFFGTEGANFIIFEVNPALSAIHLLLGGVLIRSSYRGPAGLDRSLAGVAVVLGLLGVLGLAMATGPVLAINTADVMAHFSIAAGALVVVAWTRA